jgi:hypothetical protein
MPASNQDIDAASEATTNIVENRPSASTPHLISPPLSQTPPTTTHKRINEASILSRDPRDPSSDPVNPTALTRALDKVVRRGDFTPGPSPSRKRARVQHDRYENHLMRFTSPDTLYLDSCPIEPVSICHPLSKLFPTTPSQVRALHQSRNACTLSSTFSEVRETRIFPVS